MSISQKKIPQDIRQGLISTLNRLRSNTLAHKLEDLPELSQPSLFSSRGLMLHSMMYALNLYSEINQLRQQYKNNKYAVFYFSRAFTSAQLFVEFFFEILNEQNEPIIAAFEMLKCILKFREYKQLIIKENIHSYIRFEAYKDLKTLKQIKDEHFFFIRSRRSQQENNEEVNRNSQASIQNNTVNKRQQEPSDSNDSSFENEAFNDLLEPRQSTIFSILFRIIGTLIKKLSNFIFNHKYHVDDIVSIVRPFVYVMTVMRFGRKSYDPIKITLTMDIIATLVSISRIMQSQNMRYHKKQRGVLTVEQKNKRLRNIEQQELFRRIKISFFKYLVRDPIFEEYTKPWIKKMFEVLRISPKVYALLISFIDYFRYYTYIA